MREDDYPKTGKGMSTARVLRTFSVSLVAAAGFAATSLAGVPVDPPDSFDFSGNDTNDLAVYNPDTSEWQVRSLDGSTFSIFWGWNEAHPVPGDYNGDGIAGVECEQISLQDGRPGARVRAGPFVLRRQDTVSFPSAGVRVTLRRVETSKNKNGFWHSAAGARARVRGQAWSCTRVSRKALGSLSGNGQVY